MNIGIIEAGAFGAAAAIAMKSLEFAITVTKQKLNGRSKGSNSLVLDELRKLNALMAKAVVSLETGAEIMNDTRERVKENQAGIDKMHRDVLLLRGGSKIT